MTAHVLQFVELSDEERKATGRIGKLAKGEPRIHPQHHRRER